MCEVLINIPFIIDHEELLKALMINNESDKNRVFELIREAEEQAVPRAVYREVFISETATDYVVIGEQKIISKLLRKNIGDSQRAYVYVITVGEELDKWAKKYTDILESYWVDEIQKMILNLVIEIIYSKLDKQLNTAITSDMNPGSLADWPLEEQAKLFSLLGNVEEKIGVKLTESYLMLPAKSISGIKFSTEEEFSNCQLCKRENCPTRRVPYQGDRL